MRIGLLPTLGVALSLQAAGALGDVICDSKPDASMQFAAGNNELCLEHFCKDLGSNSPAVAHCGEVVFSVTKLGAELTEAECLAQIKSILDQCLTTKAVQGGISQTPEALYEVHPADDEGSGVPDEGGPKDADEDEEDEEEDKDDDEEDEDDEDEEEDDLTPAGNDTLSTEEGHVQARTVEIHENEFGAGDIHDIWEHDGSPRYLKARRARGGRTSRTRPKPTRPKTPKNPKNPKNPKTPKTPKTPKCTAAMKKAGKCGTTTPPKCTAAMKKAGQCGNATCTAAQKKANGGKCPPKTPKCTAAMKKAGKCPDTCTAAEKKVNGGKCPPTCSAAVKKKNGGVCPPTCTAAEKKANGGKCPTCTAAEKKKNRGKCPPKACPIRKKPGTAGAGTKKGGKKTVRDIVEGLLPEVVARAILPRTSPPTSPGGSRPSTPTSPGAAGSSGQDQCGPDIRDWYMPRILDRKTKYWRFQKKSGWSNALDEAIAAGTHDATLPAAKRILREMTDGGKLDVIRVNNGQIEVKGKASGGSHPEEWLTEPGSYVLSNGGFFRMDGDKQPPIGKASHTTNVYPIPQEFLSDYAYLGSKTENNFFATGPKLDRDLVFSDPKWKYWENRQAKIVSTVAKKPGSLAHASEPNERLVYVELRSGHKYLFAYTALNRNHGVDLNKMRAIILVFLRHMQSVTAPTKILNMDGGGSVYVAWKPASRPFEVLARGETGDGVPGEPGSRAGHIREVTNYLKIDSR